MAPPLAGKPPFATDHPDSVFADPPKPTPRPKKQNIDTTAPGGPRESAYNTFDSYFTGGNGPDPRASGVGDIGRGLMNAGSDYDDSSDDEQPQPHPKKQASPTNNQSSDKHRALFAAATGAALSDPPPPSYEPAGFGATQEKQRSPSPEQPSPIRTVQQPQAVVHARANDWTVSQHAEPSTPPVAGMRSMAQQQQMPPAALQAGGRPLAAPAPRAPQAAFMQGQRPGLSPSNSTSPYHPGAGPMPGSPSPTTRMPQPLPPPQSPIMPVFARPRKETAVKFNEKGEIMRGNSEETLLPRGAGGKGDDFWRRFSMVAKEEAKGGSKKSAWLKKTENGTTRLSTWVWLVGILLLLAIGGGVGLGWYLTHNKPGSQPVAIGGSANESFTSTSSAAAHVSTSSIKATKVTAAPVPTNTANNNDRRDEHVPTLVQAIVADAAAPIVPPAHRRSLISRMPH